MIPIQNFRFILDGKLAIHAHPCFATPQPLEQLANKGINFIVSLDEYGLDPDSVMDADLGYYHIPIEDYTCPASEQLQEFIDLVELNEMRELVTSAHCRLGIGRSGIMAACYMVHKGWNVFDALRRVESLDKTKMLDSQSDFVYQYWEKFND